MERQAADAIAGGILAGGELVLDHSTVSGNQGIHGGGIRGDTITLINSTVTNNSVPVRLNVAGGVNYNLNGSLTMINSVVARNTRGQGSGRLATPFPPKVSSVTRSSRTTRSRIVCLDTSASHEGQNIASDKSCGAVTGDARRGSVARPAG